MNIYDAYAKRAYSHVNAPQKLLGPIKTRAAARLRYGDIVAELEACEDSDMIEGLLASLRPELLQFETELPLFWNGDGDFAGLANEIARARARVDEAPAFSGIR